MDQLTLFLQQLLNGISLGSIYGLIALGYTMVYGVLRFINFAHGDVYMLGAFTGLFATEQVYRFIPLDHFDTFSVANFFPVIGSGLIILLVAMVVCAVIGVLIERIAYRPLRERPRLTVLITAIGVSLFLQNMTQFFLGPQPRAFPQVIPVQPIEGIGTLCGYLITAVAPEAAYLLQVPGLDNLTLLTTQGAIILSTIVLLLGLRLVVMRTKLGLAMRALSVNPTACALMGVNNDVVISFTFALGSALAAAAGILVSMDSPSVAPLMGNIPGIKAFVAAVLGGIGNIPGAAVGGLIIGVLETLVVGYLRPEMRDAIAFAVLIVILIWKPTGIFGRVEREKV
jgi:branched-chain amino acid transport system permease protein